MDTNILDFEFSHFSNEDFEMNREFEVVGPTPPEFFNWDGWSDVHETVESDLGPTLDFGGEMTQDRTVSRCGFSSSEIESEEQGQQVIDAVIAEIRSITGWTITARANG